MSQNIISNDSSANTPTTAICELKHAYINKELNKLDSRLCRIEFAIWIVAVSVGGAAISVIMNNMAWAVN